MGQHAMWGGASATYVVLSTDSPDLVTTPGVHQGMLMGTDNLYVAKVSYDGAVIDAATYIGTGASGYEPSGIKVDAAGRLLLSGSMFGTPGHPVTADAEQMSPAGGHEAWLSILSADMSSLLYSTYVGGSDDDRIRDVFPLSAGGAVVIGDSWSADFSTTPGAYQDSLAGEGDAWVRAYAAVPGG